MTSNTDLDKNSFRFLFNEDIYSISEKTAILTKENKEGAKLPNQAIEKVPVLNKDYAIILRNQEELNSGKELLKKILGAIKLDLNNVEILFSDSIENEFITSPKFKYIISFGLDALQYQYSFYKVSKNKNTSYLFSNSLGELEKDIPKKKALWAALQEFL